MKKLIVFAAAIFFSSLGAFSQSKAALGDWNFFAETKIGARLAAYDEIVWGKRKIDGERYKLSELNYEVTPALYAGVDLTAAFKRLGISFLSKFFFAQKTGTLKDSDWRNDDFCSNGDTWTKTDYSEHTLYLMNGMAGVAGYDLELKADFKFYPASFLTIFPLLSANIQWMNFSARNGMGWYGSYNNARNAILPYDDIATRLTYSFEGKHVLEYEVYNFFAWTGIRADFAVTPRFSVSLSSELSPISLFFDFDNHLTNSRLFKENSISIFYAFRQTVKAEFKVNKNFSFCQTCVFAFTGESEGSMYYKKKEDARYSKLANNNGGGQALFADIEISAKISW